MNHRLFTKLAKLCPIKLSDYTVFCCEKVNLWFFIDLCFKILLKSQLSIALTSRTINKMDACKVCFLLLCFLYSYITSRTVMFVLVLTYSAAYINTSLYQMSNSELWPRKVELTHMHSKNATIMSIYT